LNRSKGIHRRDFPEIASVHDMPYCTDRTCTTESCDCGVFFDDTSALRRMLHPETGYVDADEVAALVIEPIQGEGGYRFPSDAFAGEIADCCAEFDLTLVADEVQAGMGRTGEWWRSDHYPFEPDVISSAKGLRVGATIGREAVFPNERSRLSSTWGAGDLLSSAMGAVTIDAIERYSLMENATTRGRVLNERLRDVDLPGVTDVRGKGLMLAVEFEADPARRYPGGGLLARSGCARLWQTNNPTVTTARQDRTGGRTRGRTVRRGRKGRRYCRGRLSGTRTRGGESTRV
jgi:4-aminobutyrate aminotransferase